MHYFVPIFLLIGISFSSLFTLPIHSESGGVYISEIQFDGSSINETDKWIELHNPTNSTVTLTDYSIKLSKNHIIPIANISIPAGGYIVIANNLSTKPSLVNQADMLANLSYMSNTTTNKYISISLLYKSQVISTFEKNNAETAALVRTKNHKYSLEFDTNGAFHSSTNLYYGTTDFGTPRMGNSVTTSNTIENTTQISSVTSPVIIASQPKAQLPVEQTNFVSEAVSVPKLASQSISPQVEKVSMPKIAEMPFQFPSQMVSPSISQSFKTPSFSQIPTISGFQNIKSIKKSTIDTPLLNPLFTIIPLLIQGLLRTNTKKFTQKSFTYSLTK
jgi:hypothetical protein